MCAGSSDKKASIVVSVVGLVLISNARVLCIKFLYRNVLFLKTVK